LQGEVHLLFLAAAALSRQEIDVNGEACVLSFSHRPTMASYWRFELWVRDGAVNRIPRDRSNARAKYLAKSILEYIVAEAVLPKASAAPFRRAEFELRPS